MFHSWSWSILSPWLWMPHRTRTLHHRPGDRLPCEGYAPPAQATVVEYIAPAVLYVTPARVAGSITLFPAPVAEAIAAEVYAAAAPVVEFLSPYASCVRSALRYSLRISMSTLRPACSVRSRGVQTSLLRFDGTCCCSNEDRSVSCVQVFESSGISPRHAIQCFVLWLPSFGHTRETVGGAMYT